MSLDSDLPPPPPYTPNDPLGARRSATFGAPGVPLSTHIIALRLRGGDISNEVPTYEQANPPPPVPLDREIIALRLRGGDIANTAPPYEHAVRERPQSQEILSQQVPETQPPADEQDGAAEISGSSTTPPLTSPLASPIPSPIPPSPNAEPPQMNFASAAQYFEERSEDVAPNLELIEHQMTIYPRSQAKDFAKLPHCWRARSDIVTQQDWNTFVNFMFPPHLTPQPQIPRKVREEMERYMKPGMQETPEQRKERMESVSAEWNEGFFVPRSLIIDFRFVTGLLDAPASPICPRCYPSSNAVARKPLSQTHLNPAMPSLPRIPSIAPISLPSVSPGSSPRSDSPNHRGGFPFQRSQTSPAPHLSQQSSHQSQPSHPHSPSHSHSPPTSGPPFMSWIQDVTERVQIYGRQIADQAQRHGDAIERHARHQGETIQQHARRIETMGDQISSFVSGPGRPRSGRWETPPASPLGASNNITYHNYHGRQRSESVSSASSRSSAGSECSIDSLSSGDLEGVDLDNLRHSLAVFMRDPNRKSDLHLAVRELREDLRERRRVNTHRRGQESHNVNARSDSFKAKRAELRAARREFKDAIKECKRERREIRNEKRRRHKERKEARRQAKREIKEAIKAGKKKVLGHTRGGTSVEDRGSGSGGWSWGSGQLARISTTPMGVPSTNTSAGGLSGGSSSGGGASSMTGGIRWVGADESIGGQQVTGVVSTTQRSQSPGPPPAAPAPRPLSSRFTSVPHGEMMVVQHRPTGRPRRETMT